MFSIDHKRVRSDYHRKDGEWWTLEPDMDCGGAWESEYGPYVFGVFYNDNIPLDWNDEGGGSRLIIISGGIELGRLFIPADLEQMQIYTL